MAREIKFRAFDKMLNRYLFGGDGFHPIGEFTILRQVEMYCDENMAGLQTTFERIGHIELEQSTGLKDKNGVEIYEGDVAECDGRRRTVRWANGKFWFVAEVSNQHEDISEMFGMYYNKVEVIGNIHQHKHLLE